MEAVRYATRNLGTQVRDEEEAFRIDIGNLCRKSEARLEKLEFCLSVLVEGSFSINVTLLSAKGQEMKRYFEFTPSRILKLAKVFQLLHDHGNSRVKMSYNGDCEPSDIRATVCDHLKSFLQGMRGEALAKRFFANLALEGGMVRSVRFATPAEDMQAIDLLVTVHVKDRDCVVPIQVKTSRFFQVGHQMKRSGKEVPSIVFNLKRLRLKALRSKVFPLLEQYVSHGRVLHVSV